MSDSEGLKELIQSALPSKVWKEAASASGRRSESEDTGRASTVSPFQSSLLATLLPPKTEHPSRASSPPSLKRSTSSGSRTRTSVTPESFPPHKACSSPSHLPVESAMKVSQSLQELHLDAVSCSTTIISQVKNPSERGTGCGAKIAATSCCLAYVLNDRKIRLLAQENAAMGIMERHDTELLPIIDLAWNSQELLENYHSSLNVHPSSQLLASVSRGGEVCIGAVYAESSSSLVYEPISVTTFPELAPARGLSWNLPTVENVCSLKTNQEEAPLLAVYGASHEVFLLSVQSTVRTASLAVDLEIIEACRFGDSGGRLYIAGKNKILIVSIRSVNDTFTADTIHLPDSIKRVWLLPYPSGVLAVAVFSDEISTQDQLLIMPLNSSGVDGSEIIVSVNLPGENVDSLFAVYDQATNVLGLGSLDTCRLVLVNLQNARNPVLAAGSWPNETGAVSVTATCQLHSVFSSQDYPADLFLYVYHKESVRMHRITVQWETTQSAVEPSQLPNPSDEILRQIRPEQQSSGSLSQASIKESDSGSSPRQQPQILKKKTHTATSPSSPLRFDSEQLQSMVQVSLKSIEKQVSSRCEAVLGSSTGHLAPTIVKQLIPSLSSSMESSIRDSVDGQLLPGLQALMTDLIGQLSANIAQAIVDSTIEQYKLIMGEMNELRQMVTELQHRAFKLPSVQELTKAISHDLRESLASSSSVASVTDPRVEYSALVEADKGDLALIRVLSQGDPSLLNWILSKLDVQNILDSPSLQQPRVQISLAQQLGYDLNTFTEVKLTWLAELLTVFNVDCGGDPACMGQLADVLDELFTNLKTLYSQCGSLSPTSPISKQLKTVMRLVRLAMSSI